MKLSRVFTGISVSYIYDLPNLGLYIVSEKPKMKFSQGWINGDKQETVTTSIKHYPVYLFLERCDENHFGITLTGQFHYLSHRIFIMSPFSFWPLLIISVEQGWAKIWYKPWKYLSFRIGKANEPPRLRQTKIQC